MFLLVWKMIRHLKEFLTKKPEKTLHLLNAGCLAKSTFVIEAVWEIICLNKNFKIFKADKKLTSALDHLINKKEFSNQTLVVGDLENPQEILVQRSRYFTMLFQPNFLEASETIVVLKGMNRTAKLQGIDYEGFLCLLRYIYTRKIHVPLNLCPIVSQLADMYLEPCLQYNCDHTIEKLLQ